MKERNYSNSDLTVLRRLWEIQKELFLDPRFLKGKLFLGKFFSEYKNTELWKNFRVEGVYNLFNGGPNNIISAYEEIIYPSKWVSPAFEIESSPFDKDALERYNR